MDNQNISGDGVDLSANNRVEINMADTSGRPQFVGLSKEELARYENDPYWKKVRMGLLLGFWAIWLILLIAAVLLLVRTPKCPKVYNLKWSRKYPGYAISVDKFTGGPLMRGTDTHAEQMSVLTDRLEYVKKMDFGQVTLYDEWLENLDDQGIIEAVVRPLRQQANSLSMMLVLEIENRDVCDKSKSDAEDKECQKLHKLIDKVLKDYDFDGISVRVFDDAEDREFEPSVIKHAKKYVDAIGKSTLKPRSLIATSNKNFDEFEADLKISSVLTQWNENSSAGEIISWIAQSKGCNAWRLDNVDGDLIASSDRGLDTNLALHTVYLLPGTPIVTYGTETFINNDECSPPIMPWNETMTYSSKTCQMQTDLKLHNVKRVSSSGYPNSPYKLIRKLTKLRDENYIFRFGTIASLKSVNDHILYWEIHEPLNPIIVVMINTKKDGSVVTVNSPIFTDKDKGCKFEILYQSNTDWTAKDEIPCGTVYLNGHAVVVLKSMTKLQEKDFLVEKSIPQGA